MRQRSAEKRNMCTWNEFNAGSLKILRADEFSCPETERIALRTRETVKLSRTKSLENALVEIFQYFEYAFLQLP